MVSLQLGLHQNSLELVKTQIAGSKLNVPTNNWELKLKCRFSLGMSPAVFLTSSSWRWHCQSTGHSGCQGSKPASLKRCTATPAHQHHQPAYLNADGNSALPRRWAGNDWNHTMGWMDSTKATWPVVLSVPSSVSPAGLFRALNSTLALLGLHQRSWKQKIAETLLKGRKREGATLLGLGTTQSSCWTPARTFNWSGTELDHHPEQSWASLRVLEQPLSPPVKRERQREVRDRGNCALITRQHLGSGRNSKQILNNLQIAFFLGLPLGFSGLLALIESRVLQWTLVTCYVQLFQMTGATWRYFLSVVEHVLCS